MKRDLINAISQEVYRRFPDLAGVRPKVKLQRSSPPQSFLLTFQSRASLPGGKSLPRLVRVVANEQGKILKISTSR